MTKLKLGLAAGAAAILAFGVAACGQQSTTATEEPAAVEATETPEAAPAEVPAADAAATDAAAPAAEGAAPAEPAPAAN